MRLPKLAIDKRRFTFIVFLLLVFMGVNSFLSMPRSEDPSMDIPVSIVRVVYPGTSSLDMEKLIVDPIEDSINELDDIKVLSSDIEDGLAVISVEFLYGSNSKDKYDDVVSSVNKIRRNLPTDIPILSVDLISPSDVSIIQVALISDTQSYGMLESYGKKLKNSFELIPGIKKAKSEAYPEQELQIQVDLDRVRALNLSVKDIMNAVQSSSVNLPGGHVLSGDRRFTVRTSGGYSNIQEIESTVVKSRNGHFILLKDIAKVSLTDSLPSYQGRFNSERAIFITASQREGSNIFDVMKSVQSKISEFKATLPKDMKVAIAYDQSGSVKDRVSLFFNNLLQGLVVVGVVVFLFLGFRSSSIVMLAIPLSVFISLSWIDYSGFGLQQMTIAGLVIALGLLVDNAIVVIENVDRFLHQGDSPLNAAVKGAQQVAWPIVSGTITTILAFFPILFLQTSAGSFLRSMPLTVIYTLLASLMIALTLTPLLSSFILKEKKEKLPFLVKQVRSFINTPYHWMLEKTLKYPKTIILSAVIAFVGALFLGSTLGVSMFPKAEKSLLVVNVELSEGSSFQQTDKVLSDIEKKLKQFSFVESFITNVGRGNPRIYYNLFANRQVPNYGQIMVHIDSNKIADIENYASQLREKLKSIVGVKISVNELLMGPPTKAPVVFRVLSDDLNQLSEVSKEIASIIENTEGTSDVDNPIEHPKVDLKVKINRAKAAMLGVPISDIDQTVRASLVGFPIGTYRDKTGEDYSIIIKGHSVSGKPKIENFDKVVVTSSAGKVVPIMQLVSLEFTNSLPRFQHYMTERMTRITANLKAGFYADTVTNDINKKLQAYHWPKGVTYQIGGEQEKRTESFSGMSTMFLVALVGIFAVLVLQFNSFRQSWVVFAAIPLALIGMVLGLWLTGFTFSFTAFIGLTSLVGIVINNSIMLVDYSNYLLKEENKKWRDAVFESAKVRFLPILLTTLTTVGGLLPLTLSGSLMWSPMGVTIIGGLLVSALLTLFVVPAFLVLLKQKVS